MLNFLSRFLRSLALSIAFFCSLGIACLLVWIAIDVCSVPNILHITPGQKTALSIHYPLSLALNPLIPAKLTHQDRFSETITLGSSKNQHFVLHLTVLGKIPLKDIDVQIAPPAMVIPGGQSIGVLFAMDGVLIVGHLPLRDENHKTCYPAKDAGLKPGDLLMAINGVPVRRVDEVDQYLRNLKNAYTLHLMVKRQGRIMNVPIQPVLCSDNTGKRYRLGVFIEDPAAGIGTLSFYDPVTHRFAGLGHRIADFSGNKAIPFQNGHIVLAKIQGIKIGYPGQPGEKIGVFSLHQPSVGQIEKNNNFGVFGRLTGDLDLSINSIPIAYASEIKPGPATIITVLKDHQAEKFQIEIIKVFRQDSPRDKGLILKVTDPRLLKETGGIIQGMSGSPIIQNGKLVGVVTHVFINDPTRGYGILAEWMFREMMNESDSQNKSKAS